MKSIMSYGGSNVINILYAIETTRKCCYDPSQHNELKYCSKDSTPCIYEYNTYFAHIIKILNIKE